MQFRGIGTNFILSLLVVGFFALSACNGDGDGNDKDTTEVGDKKFLLDSNRGTLFQVGDELFSIPSPVQTAILIKKSGASYNKEMLNDPKSAPSYSTKFLRSLNLGVYGADLGYVTMYDKTQDALAFMNSTKKIADDLGISQAFGKTLFERFQENLGNRDSLLVLVSDAYRKSDAYLKNNERDDVGALILAGGWLEALYFATNVVQISANPEVKIRIGEQKTSLENLIKLLQKYRNNEEIAEFVEDLIDLYYLFDDVQITYVFEEPDVYPENKITTINSKSDVQITEEQLQAIADRVKMLRNEIVG